MTVSYTHLDVDKRQPQNVVFLQTLCQCQAGLIAYVSNMVNRQRNLIADNITSLTDIVLQLSLIHI